MSAVRVSLPAGQQPGGPLTALAPMQDVTDLAFMRVIAHYGAPDYFFTEFFRVHAHSRPEAHILRSIDENTTGRPVFAQLIGEDLGHLGRTTEALLRHKVAGIEIPNRPLLSNIPKHPSSMEGRVSPIRGRILRTMNEHDSILGRGASDDTAAGSRR